MDIAELVWHNDIELKEHYAVLPTGRVVAELERCAELALRSMGDPTWTERTIWYVYLLDSKAHIKVLGLAKAKLRAEELLRSM